MWSLSLDGGDPELSPGMEERLIEFAESRRVDSEELVEKLRGDIREGQGLPREPEFRFTGKEDAR